MSSGIKMRPRAHDPIIIIFLLSIIIESIWKGAISSYIDLNLFFVIVIFILAFDLVFIRKNILLKKIVKAKKLKSS